MRHNVSFLSRTSLLVLAFALLLSAGILSLSHFYGGVEPNDGTFLTPETAVAAPTAQDLLQKKFDTYNTVTEKDGKKTVTIYSEQQISDFNTRRHNGEWFWLSSEETLFLINDTIKLFETYDEVYVRALDGTVKKYYGLSFFSSEAYFASFGGFDLGVTDASFDLKKDVYETILARITVLNSAMLDETNCLSDLNFRPDAIELTTLKRFENPWNIYIVPSAKSICFGYWNFHQETIRYTSNIDNQVYLFTKPEGTVVYPQYLQNSSIGAYKYDQGEKNIVIELYETKTNSMIARIRLDKRTHAEELYTIESLFANALDSIKNSSTVAQNSQYRAAVYLNGFYLHNEPIPPILYCPDGDLDLYSFTNDHAIFETEFSLNGGSRFAQYINDLLYSALS